MSESHTAVTKIMVWSMAQRESETGFCGFYRYRVIKDDGQTVFFWTCGGGKHPQKQFITDASHELKTPLTIIDANTEVIEMETGENQWTKSTRKQIQRLSGMVQQLVALSRLDENRDIGEKTEFSASDAVLETVQPYEAPVRTGGKEMEQLVDEGILFTGNERDFRQLVGILVDNAVKYTPEGGKIRIALKKKRKEMPAGNF